MDPELKKAASTADLQFLEKAMSEKPSDYFLVQCQQDEDDIIAGNLFHVAAWKGQGQFFQLAFENLPIELRKTLVFQPNEDGWNPFHVASLKSNHKIVELIIRFYKSSSFGKLSSRDTVLIKALDEDKGVGLLFLAVYLGYTKLAEKILIMFPSSLISLAGKGGSNPLHFAPNCSETVYKLLLKNHPDLIEQVDNRGFTILHQWVVMRKAWPCKLLLEFENDFSAVRNKVFTKLVCTGDFDYGDTPLHIVARSQYNDIVPILIRGYQQEIARAENPEEVVCPPWKVKNRYGTTPLHSALWWKREENAMEILLVDPTLCEICDNEGESPFFLAVRAGSERVMDEILKTHDPHFNLLRRNDGKTVLHLLPSCPEKMGRRIVEKYWWMINFQDNSQKTALAIAKEENSLWLMDMLMNSSAIRRQNFNWVEACKREDTPAVLAFIDHCPDLPQVCREQNDTPLHHIKLPSYKDYFDFLKNPNVGELKNMTDYDGATPLHRAIQRKDMLLAKALLTDKGVKRNMADHYGTTALDSLAKLCKEHDDWMKMCKQIKVNPYLRTTYIQPGTNMEQMRNTLSVVAALLATITFAAGFTLPGGLDSNSGEANLAKEPAFLIFLLSDVYAMCTSMLVLFCLIWSMVLEDEDMSRLLVDRSVYVLMQSLYGTLLAFMTGVYTVISHKSLWAAIIIFFMCSIVGVSANRTILHNVLAKFIPSPSQPLHNDQQQLLQV